LLGDRVVVSPTEPTGDNRKKVWFKWSNNLLNYNDLTNLAINFGVKVDGENVYSTATSDSREWNYNNSNWFVTLPAGTYNFSLSYSKQSTNSGAGLGIYLKDKRIVFEQTQNISNYNYTFILDKESKVGIMLKIYDGILKIQIEQGSKATTFQPYVEPQIFIKNSNEVYEEFIKKNGEITLYENQDGNNGYEIELLDTVKKCAEVEIYGIGDNNIRIYQKILNPNEATFEMSSEVMYEGTEYINKALCAFINNKFYKYQDREYKIDVTSANVRNVTASNWLKIVKIVGILN
jgi:hypothetical protein